MDAWNIELLVVRDGSHDSGERNAVSRGVERGHLLRLRRGVAVERIPFEALSAEQQHVVRMRAVAAVSAEPIVFSHFSAALLHDLPVLLTRFGRIHSTVPVAIARGRDGVAGHVFRLDQSEIVQFGPLLATSIGRTVVDIAGASPFGEGLMAADAALRAGTDREVLQRAIDLAGPRQSGRRIQNVVAVAHPGAGSPNESMSRSNMIKLGYEPPDLQYPLWDAKGFVAFLDFWFRRQRIGCEADGLVKFLDPAMATQGAGRAVWDEKRREDRVLPLVSGLARWGWQESCSPLLLRQRLAAFGVHPASPRATIADYAAAAKDARPRFTPARSAR